MFHLPIGIDLNNNFFSRSGFTNNALVAKALIQYFAARRILNNMIYTPMTKLALNLCFEAHKDQKDKSGIPYVFHPFHVAEQMNSEQATIVALLHDVIEDSCYSLGDIADMGFDTEVVEALRRLTHEAGVSYMEYINAIKHNELAKAVKIEDLKHNSDFSRLNLIDEKVLERQSKYNEALRILNE